MALFQNLLAFDDRIKVHCFTILGGIGHTTYFQVDEKVLSLMCMIRKLDSEVNKTDQIKFFVCWMETVHLHKLVFFEKRMYFITHLVSEDSFLCQDLRS